VGGRRCRTLTRTLYLPGADLPGEAAETLNPVPSLGMCGHSVLLNASLKLQAASQGDRFLIAHFRLIAMLRRTPPTIIIRSAPRTPFASQPIGAKARKKATRLRLS